MSTQDGAAGPCSSRRRCRAQDRGRSRRWRHVVRAVVRVIGRDVRLALASSSPYAIVGAVLERLDLAATFACVHSAEEEPYGKPHPGVYLTTARKLVARSGTAGARVTFWSWRAPAALCVGYISKYWKFPNRRFSTPSSICWKGIIAGYADASYPDVNYRYPTLQLVMSGAMHPVGEADRRCGSG